MNVQKLVNISLGDMDNNVDVSAFGDAFAEALAKHKERQAAEVVNELIKLLGLVEQEKDTLRTSLRMLRRQMDAFEKFTPKKKKSK